MPNRRSMAHTQGSSSSQYIPFRSTACYRDEDEVSQAILLLPHRLNTRDAAALTMASVILAGASRLYRAVVEEEQLVNDVTALTTASDIGLWYLRRSPLRT